jgi:predicted SnoaL-like aldol condensation-catalyzing enzyme
VYSIKTGAGKEDSMADLERNKQTVIAFYTRAFNDKQPADAVAKYVGPEYIQHNPHTPDGAKAFIQSQPALSPSFRR